MGEALAGIRQHVRGALFGTDPKFQARVDRQLGILKPFLNICEGKAGFLPIEQVSADAVRQSILALLGLPGNRTLTVRIVRAENWGDIPADHEDYICLGAQPAMLESARIGAILGEERFRDLLRLVGELTAGMGQALMGQFADFFTGMGPGLRAAVIGSFFIYTASFIGAVMINDADGVRRLAPMVRSMAQVIVIGAPKSEPGTWVALCA